jgi:hypothetical protein
MEGRNLEEASTRRSNHGHQQSRDSEEGVRAKVGTRGGKARLAIMEKAHAPISELPYLQAEVTTP